MRILYAFLFALALGTTAVANAELVVVVNPDSDVTEISRNDAINIFMGRYRKLPNGTTALPLDLEPVKARFYAVLVGKQLSEINAYWARLMFSGQSSPPQQLTTSLDISSVVNNNRGAIGYMDAADITDQVRVVLRLPED